MKLSCFGGKKMRADQIAWLWGERFTFFFLVTDSENRASLSKNGITHILSVYNNAKPMFEVSRETQLDDAFVCFVICLFNSFNQSFLWKILPGNFPLWSCGSTCQPGGGGDELETSEKDSVMFGHKMSDTLHSVQQCHSQFHSKSFWITNVRLAHVFVFV